MVSHPIFLKNVVQFNQMRPQLRFQMWFEAILRIYTGLEHFIINGSLQNGFWRLPLIDWKFNWEQFHLSINFGFEIRPRLKDGLSIPFSRYYEAMSGRPSQCFLFQSCGRRVENATFDCLLNRENTLGVEPFVATEEECQVLCQKVSKLTNLKA